MNINKKIISLISSTIMSVILINLGAIVIKQEIWIGIITILNGFVLLYFTYYSLQIGTNEKDISRIKEWIETKEEILNTLKDIVILKKISQIK